MLKCDFKQNLNVIYEALDVNLQTEMTRILQFSHTHGIYLLVNFTTELSESQNIPCDHILIAADSDRQPGKYYTIKNSFFPRTTRERNFLPEETETAASLTSSKHLRSTCQSSRPQSDKYSISEIPIVCTISILCSTDYLRQTRTGKG